MQKKGLGKGLGALITPVENNETGVVEVDINKIEPNKNQPRKNFDEESLLELSDSIKQHGIVQPLIVKAQDDYFTIIAGERRWRAARIAKLSKIPVIIKDYSDSEIIQIALIENLQREDLNPIEEAEGYKKLSEDFLFSQEDIALKVGKKRSKITQYLSLLNLDKRVQNFLAEKKISVAHGRLLLTIEDGNKQFQVAEQVIEDSISVKHLESIIKSANEAEIEEEKPKAKPANTYKSVYKNIEDDLKNILGSKVQIKNKGNKGRIEIEYYSNDELDRLLSLFKTIG